MGAILARRARRIIKAKMELRTAFQSAILGIYSLDDTAAAEECWRILDPVEDAISKAQEQVIELAKRSPQME